MPLSRATTTTTRGLGAVVPTVVRRTQRHVPQVGVPSFLCPNLSLTRAPSIVMLCNTLLLHLKLNACAGDACSSPCICNDGDSGHDVKCVDGTLAAIPCHIPPQANGVYLSNNAITSISRGDLPPALRQLQYIFIDHNRLSSLDGDSFRGLTVRSREATLVNFERGYTDGSCSSIP